MPTRCAAPSSRAAPTPSGSTSPGQLLTEDYYALDKLAKGFLGTNHVDSNSRLCMSSAVAGYERAFGVDGPPTCYDDLERADLFLVVGANMAWCHPVLFQRLERARAARRPRPALVVLDPRRTATAESADLHVPLRPGSDAVFLSGLLAELARRGDLARDWIDAHTENFEALEAALFDFPIERVERECGVPRELLAQVAELWAGAGAALSLWAMGVNQSAHGTDTVSTLVNLHLATAQLGRPGAGPFSLTGQPNAMGGREVGAMATLLAGHRRLASERDRREVEAIWGSPPIAAAPGRTAVELFEHAAEGGLDVLWIVATNPAVTLPDQATVRRALERTPLVVVQDVVGATDTARYADLLLPAAGWGEKSGTMTNSERGVARLAAAVPPPGEALPDWRIAARVAERLGYGHAFAWRSDAEVYAEHVATTLGRDCDKRGITAERLGRRAAPMAVPRRRASRGSPPLHRRAFPDAERPRPLRGADPPRRSGADLGRRPDRAHHGPRARPVAHDDEDGARAAPAGAHACAGARARARPTRRGWASRTVTACASARRVARSRWARGSATTLPEGVAFAPMHWSDGAERS